MSSSSEEEEQAADADQTSAAEPRPSAEPASNTNAENPPGSRGRPVPVHLMAAEISDIEEDVTGTDSETGRPIDFLSLLSPQSESSDVGDPDPGRTSSTSSPLEPVKSTEPNTSRQSSIVDSTAAMAGSSFGGGTGVYDGNVAAASDVNAGRSAVPSPLTIESPSPSDLTTGSNITSGADAAGDDVAPKSATEDVTRELDGTASPINHRRSSAPALINNSSSRALAAADTVTAGESAGSPNGTGLPASTTGAHGASSPKPPLIENSSSGALGAAGAGALAGGEDAGIPGGTEPAASATHVRRASAPMPPPTDSPISGVVTRTAAVTAGSMAPSVAANIDESQSSTAGANKSVVTIEHKVKNSSNRFIGFSAMKKPLIAFGVMYVLFVTGSAAFLFNQFRTIPGLEDQIDELEEQNERLEQQVNRLEEQNTRLEGQIDRLAAENDEFRELNRELEANNEEFRSLNEQLNVSNAEYERLNGELNRTVERLETSLNSLQQENDRLEALSSELNETSIRLNDEVQELEEQTANLTQVNSNLQTRNEELQNNVESLESLNANLSQTVNGLNQQVDTLESEVDRLTGLNNDLITIVSFLNETAGQVDETFEQLAALLADEIERNRALTLAQLQNTYTQRVNNWNCIFSDVFNGRDFVEDVSSPIGSQSYQEVMDYVDREVLSRLCLNRTDFESFLADEYENGTNPPVDLTVSELFAGVDIYTTGALDYYFPDSGDEPGGLTSIEWAAAGYNCANLPSNRTFQFS